MEPAVMGELPRSMAGSDFQMRRSWCGDRGTARLMLRALNRVAKQRSGKFVVIPELVDAESAGLRLPLQSSVPSGS
jgi:hypothetical protein